MVSTEFKDKLRSKINTISRKFIPNKTIDKLGKSVPNPSKKLKTKNLIKKKSPAEVNVSQPVAVKDKSRFFKQSWEEEEKQLYFK